MSAPIHIEAVERILSAIYASGDRKLSSFLFGKPGAAHWEKSLGTEIFVKRKDYIKALLFIRQNGAPYLRAISMSDLWTRVTRFITENFWYIHAGEFQRRHDCSYAAQISIEQKVALAGALSQSPLFNSTSELTLYPLIPVRVVANFESDFFFLINASDLSARNFPIGIKPGDLAPERFPPMSNWDRKKNPTSSWLGVRAPLPFSSRKTASAILGALALTPIPRERYSFSGRKMSGGICTVSAEYSVTMSDDPHTPPIASDIVLTEADHDWLAILARVLEDDHIASRSKARALEYFYRAWFLDPRERFPVLCMSLDSLVGVLHGHTAAAVKYVKNTVNEPLDDERLRLLMRLRGAVVHGAAPDVYDSVSYEKYYSDYETDPIRDLELLVAKCLRQVIFGDTLKYHADPHQELIADARAKGHFPANLDESCILKGD